MIYVNMELMIIYRESGVLICKDIEQFNRMIITEKKKIADRFNVLERFEPWEVDSTRSLRMLLLSRSRNASEKKLVLEYIQHMNKES
jgi:hypothetical protein